MEYKVTWLIMCKKASTRKISCKIQAIIYVIPHLYHFLFFLFFSKQLVKWMGIDNVRPHLQNHVIYRQKFTLSRSHFICTFAQTWRNANTYKAHGVNRPTRSHGKRFLQGGDLVWIRMMWIVWQRTIFTIKVMKITPNTIADRVSRFCMLFPPTWLCSAVEHTTTTFCPFCDWWQAALRCNNANCVGVSTR